MASDSGRSLGLISQPAARLQGHTRSLSEKPLTKKACTLRAAATASLDWPRLRERVVLLIKSLITAHL